MILAADIGGTKTNLALITTDRGPRRPLKETRYASAQHESLGAIVGHFLGENADLLAADRLKAAAFGVAGPIAGDVAQITNLPWLVSRVELAAALDLRASRVALLNDLEATATAVPHLLPADLHTLNVGQPTANGPIGVIAPGTGLGEAYLTWDGSRYRAHPSEGGHTDFAPANETQLALLNYLYRQYEHVSAERVCSGMGLPNIYHFFKDTGLALEPPWLADALAEASDATPIIVGHALDDAHGAEICRLTLDMFVAILGAEAGNLAVTLLASGGIYVGGGIPPRILTVLESPLFINAFRNKGRFQDLMDRIPVHVILNPNTALLGVAYAGMALLEAP